jgi:hypothetical protein
MKEILNILPLEISILIILLLFISIVLFVFIDKFYSSIKYKASFIYYLEFVLNWEEISNKMKANKNAKKYFKIIILLNVVFLFFSFWFILEISKISQ